MYRLHRLYGVVRASFSDHRIDVQLCLVTFTRTRAVICGPPREGD